jgi:DNA polymerase-3 subunit chi
MRVDFYQLSRDPVEKVVALLAGKVLGAGARLLIVAAEEEMRDALSRSLWAADGFLAHGLADQPHADRQPIVLSGNCTAPNQAAMLLLADGIWREEATQFDRAMLLFDGNGTEAARKLWLELKAREGMEPRIFKQTANGGWREGA